MFFFTPQTERDGFGLVNLCSCDGAAGKKKEILRFIMVGSINVLETVVECIKSCWQYVGPPRTLDIEALSSFSKRAEWKKRMKQKNLDRNEMHTLFSPSGSPCFLCSSEKHHRHERKQSVEVSWTSCFVHFTLYSIACYPNPEATVCLSCMSAGAWMVACSSDGRWW